jgi:hypothetical protein
MSRALLQQPCLAALTMASVVAKTMLPWTAHSSVLLPRTRWARGRFVPKMLPSTAGASVAAAAPAGAAEAIEELECCLPGVVVAIEQPLG